MGNKYRYEFVKQQIDGLIYFNQYIKLKKIGMVYRGLCPFHNEKTPSLTIYPKGYIDQKTHLPQQHASFYCFGCGAGGDVIEFKKHKENLESRMEACEALEVELGINVNDETAQQNFLQEQLQNIKNSQGNVLSLTEINLIISCMSRNYLSWVKEYYEAKYIDECTVIDKYYLHFDQALLDMTSIEAMSLIDEVKEKIDKRRKILKEENGI